MAAAAAPAAADVTTVIDTGRTLQVTGDAGQDRITIALNPVNSARLNVSVAGGPDVRTFERSAFDRIQIDTNGADDEIEVGAGITETQPLTATLGSGSDRFVGSPGPETVLGGQGSDRLVGDAGADTLAGESGSDVIIGGQGADVISAGTDDDRIFRDTGDGDDEIAGGPGADRLELDGTLNDDFWGLTSAGDERPLIIQMPSEPAEIEPKGIETIFIDGRAGNDTTGTGPDIGVSLEIDGGTGDDSLTGGKGDDVIVGDEGNDRLFGRQGENTLEGGPGSDVFSCELTDIVADLTPEDNCFGGSPAPEVPADPPAPPADPAVPPADVPGPPVVPAGPGAGTATRPIAIARGARVDRRGRVAVQLSCPAAGACTGRLVLKNRSATAGSARFTIAAGRSKTVRVQLNARARRTLRRAGKLKLTATAGTAKRTLRVTR